jgi:hypothetical protein
LAQDLHAFLHALFSALGQAGQSSAASGETAAASGETATAAAASSTHSGSGGYGQQRIINALQSLVANLSGSQDQGLGSSSLSNLNTDFGKLIGDLNGGASNTAGITSAATATGSASSANASSASSSALQAFLTSFVQDLQVNGGSSQSALGNSVDATA